MNQTPVSYQPQGLPIRACQSQQGTAPQGQQPQYQPQPCPPQQCPPQLSYNAVKIDIHNPKVMDGNPMSAYSTSNAVPCYPGYYVPSPQPVNQPQEQPQNQPQGQTQPVNQPQGQPVTPQPPAPGPQGGQQTQQPVNQPQQTTVTPAQDSPQQTIQQTTQPSGQSSPSIQVINNGVPQTQTINQGPQQGQQVNNPTQTTTQTETPVTTTAPKQELPAYDITPVLNGLKSKNMLEQSAALEKIGDISEKPEEIKNYLEPQVLDALLGILHADTKGLEGPTKEQEAARAKLIKEMDLPQKDQTITPQEKELAMTLAPKELADKNKQHAMYSIAILQKTLSDEVEKQKGEKLSIEKLPAIDHIVNVVKSDPNPVLRASALVALAHLNKEEYKPVLMDILTLAQKDQDPNVQQVATEALDRVKNNRTFADGTM
ncbi:HEAT repeat domain-containing protein [bacterium]|nr:HEAT repeat domain-containing protein [bacterium]